MSFYGPNIFVDHPMADFLSDNEKKRYLRQIMITSWDETVQMKLKKAHVFVAGAGGLGSPSIYYLAAAGVGRITICDNDRVELSNLNRQILHRTGGIGILKVESAGDAVMALNDTISVNLVPQSIEAPEMKKIIESADIILDCLDSFKARSVLNRMCIETKKPLVHAGITEMHGQATFIHAPETPCLNCFLPDTDGREQAPVLGATAGILGSIQAMEAVKYITGFGDTLKNRLLFFDGRSMSFSTIKLSRNPHCTACSAV